MKLSCYPLVEEPAELVPGRQERDWMDATRERHPYRCLPLNIANTSGWEMLVPTPFRATWNGGEKTSDMTIESPFHLPMNAHAGFAMSHFGNGVLTFHPGYLFRTEPGWDLWVGGAPNWIKHGIQPLTGIVESSWLPHPFTMNWKFTEPGTVAFQKGEPMAWIMPIPHAAVDDVEPIFKDINAEPELLERHELWKNSRSDFLSMLKQRTDGTGGWQRHYFKGEHIDGAKGADDHVNKRRLKTPRKAEPGE